MFQMMKGNCVTYRQAVRVGTLLCVALISVLTLEAVNMESEKLGKSVTIANSGTSNPVLLYNGKPMMRMGSVSETGLFAFPWDSSEAVVADKTHSQWAEWQKINGMGYARAYPESGFTWWGKESRSERIIPWKVDHWVYDYNPDGEPVVDLTQPDDNYWKEFENTLQKCKENDIVVIIQLYQACYFGLLSSDKTGHKRTWWEMSFFHPKNNVNHWPIGAIWKRNTGKESGNDFMQRCVDDYHGNRNTWWKMHSDYVRRILDSIGDKGNVIIDLGNELGYPEEGFHCYEWVEKTIDVIKEWEAQHNVDILIGMDEHFWFRVPGKSDWVRAHPRLDLLIVHGGADVLHEENWDFNKGFTPRDPGKLRIQYKKPSVTIQNHLHSGKGEMDAAFQRSYHWLGMMQKVQGLASYGYGKFVEDETEREKFESDTRFLMDICDSLKDYTALVMNDESSGKITEAPGYDKYKYLLSSDKETLFYTHTEEYGVTVPEEQVLKLNSLDLPDGGVRIRVIKLHDQSIEKRTDEISNGSINIALPSFFEDIAVYIEPGE